MVAGCCRLAFLAGNAVEIPRPLSEQCGPPRLLLLCTRERLHFPDLPWPVDLFVVYCGDIGRRHLIQEDDVLSQAHGLGLQARIELRVDRAEYHDVTASCRLRFERSTRGLIATCSNGANAARLLVRRQALEYQRKICGGRYRPADFATFSYTAGVEPNAGIGRMLLIELAPRPGLEPGTCGLTVRPVIARKAAPVNDLDQNGR